MAKRDEADTSRCFTSYTDAPPDTDEIWNEDSGLTARSL